jgi:hypothetical protein
VNRTNTVLMPAGASPLPSARSVVSSPPATHRACRRA